MLSSEIRNIDGDELFRYGFLKRNDWADRAERLEFDRRILIKMLKKRQPAIERYLKNLWEARDLDKDN